MLFVESCASYNKSINYCWWLRTIR